MSRALAFLVSVSFLCGCSRSDDFFAGYTCQSGDLGAFILAQANKLGARVARTNDLPALKADWRFKEAPGSVQVFIAGNCLTQLHSFFTNSFGPPASPLTKGWNRGAETIGTCYGWEELGAGLWYEGYVSKEGEQWTQFNMHSAESLKSGR
jgi:hypothetical protein